MASKYQNLMDVSGLVAVVTGGTEQFDLSLNIIADICTGGTGLGLTVARTLESNGAKVYITGRRKEKLEEAAKLAVSLAIRTSNGLPFCSFCL